MEITWQALSGITALIALYGVCEWRIHQRFMDRKRDVDAQVKDANDAMNTQIKTVWKRFDENNQNIKSDYVRKDLHDIVNQQHTENIKEIKSDVHSIKVSLEAMNKSLSVLLSRDDKK